jgi:hypothetical protein
MSSVTTNLLSSLLSPGWLEDHVLFTMPRGNCNFEGKGASGFVCCVDTGFIPLSVVFSIDPSTRLLLFSASIFRVSLGGEIDGRRLRDSRRARRSASMAFRSRPRNASAGSTLDVDDHVESGFEAIELV